MKIIVGKKSEPAADKITPLTVMDQFRRRRKLFEAQLGAAGLTSHHEMRAQVKVWRKFPDA